MLEPLGDRVIIKVDKPKEKEVGGIVIANNAKDKPQTGQVVAVGDGKVLDNGKKVAPVVKKGDTVMFDQYSGTKVEYDDEKYLVLHENDLLAIVK